MQLSAASDFLRWATSSGLRCTVFFSFVFAVPECLYFLRELYLSGTLNVVAVLVLVTMGFGLGAVVGVLLWVTIFKPLRAKLEARAAARRHVQTS
jgi:hypothetical protein